GRKGAKKRIFDVASFLKGYKVGNLVGSCTVRTWKVHLQNHDSAAALLLEIGPITNPATLAAGCHGDRAIILADFLQSEVTPCVGGGGNVTITVARWVEF